MEGEAARDNCRDFPTGRNGNILKLNDSTVIMRDWKCQEFPTLIFGVFPLSIPVSGKDCTYLYVTKLIDRYNS